MQVMGHKVAMPENPYVKALVWFIGIGASIVIGTVSVQAYTDGRYMLAAAANAQFANTNQNIEYFADTNTKRYIEDKLFVLEQKAPAQLTDIERAQISKYRRDLRALIDRWNQKGRPLDR